MTDNKINQKFHDLIQEFILENNKHNLSAIKDPQEIQTKHIDDSLKILDYMDRKLFKWLPFLRLWAWQIVIILKNPKKSHLNRSDSKKYVKTWAV